MIYAEKIILQLVCQLWSIQWKKCYWYMKWTKHQLVLPMRRIAAELSLVKWSSQLKLNIKINNSLFHYIYIW